VFRELAAAAVLAAVLACMAGAGRAALPAYVFTLAPRYEPKAWLGGRDRFPAGAALMFVSGQTRRKVASGLYASADAAVSLDGGRVLFAGKRTAAEHWQIWEAALDGGLPRQITSCESDCVRPLYLPDDRIVYTQITPHGSDVEIVPLNGGKPARLTFAPGWYLTDDVLRDGRILLEAAEGRGPSWTRELFTVYPDGTGVESLRCDHGPDRSDARQISSGDVVFDADGRLARFTSALANQTETAQPDGDSAGPVAEVEAGSWILALRRKPRSAYGLFLWTAANGQMLELEVPAGTNAIQPAIARSRIPPRQFPTALVPSRTTGNLLCLNARSSKTPLAADARALRVYTQASGGAPVLLGQTDLAPDGSFYVEVPADRPLRIEMVDSSGRAVRAEHDWFWMRPSEQRICVGCHLGPERAPENKVPDILVQTTVPVKMLGDAGRQQ